MTREQFDAARAELSFKFTSGAISFYNLRMEMDFLHKRAAGCEGYVLRVVPSVISKE